MTTRFKLELIVDVELNGEDAGLIAENLNYLVNNAMGNGIVTGDSAATVDMYSSKVEIL